MSAGPVILDPDETSGVVESDDGARVAVRLADGSLVELPAALVERRPDGLYRTGVSFEAFGGGEGAVLQEIEERLNVTTQVRETGRVVVQTATEFHEEAVAARGWRETVEVERVPIGRVVEAIEPPRTEGDVTVIPVYDEVLVVHKKLILREEVRLVTRREPAPAAAPVALRRQTVTVERLPPADAGTPER